MLPCLLLALHHAASPLELPCLSHRLASCLPCLPPHAALPLLSLPHLASHATSPPACPTSKSLASHAALPLACPASCLLTPHATLPLACPPSCCLGSHATSHPFCPASSHLTSCLPCLSLPRPSCHLASWLPRLTPHAASPPCCPAIAPALTRYKTMPTMESVLKNQGVKKVDYLLEKIWLKGLTRMGDGLDMLKLIILHCK